jgi:hypothetical protein
MSGATLDLIPPVPKPMTKCSLTSVINKSCDCHTDNGSSKTSHARISFIQYSRNRRDSQYENSNHIHYAEYQNRLIATKILICDYSSEEGSNIAPKLEERIESGCADVSKACSSQSPVPYLVLRKSHPSQPVHHYRPLHGSHSFEKALAFHNM